MASRGPAGPNGGLGVLVIDDHRLFGESLVEALERCPEIAWCELAMSADDGLPVVQDRSPDVVVMDVHLEGSTADDVVRRIRLLDVPTRVVLFSRHTDLEALVAAVQAGADGFVPQGTSLDELRRIVLAAPEDDVVADAGTLAAVSEAIREREASDTGTAERLSPREREILALLAEGSTVEDISGQLGISRETARGYVKTLLQKLGAHSQLQAVVIASRRGLLGSRSFTNDGGG